MRKNLSNQLSAVTPNNIAGVHSRRLSYSYNETVSVAQT